MKKLMIPFFVLFAVFILIGGGCISSSDSSTGANAVDEMAYQTYTNESLNYKIVYPREWFKYVTQNAYNLEILSFTQEEIVEGVDPDIEMNFAITPYPIEEVLPAEMDTKEEITFAGMDAIEISYSMDTEGVGKAILVQNGENTYVFSFTEEKEQTQEIQDILNRFEFLN